MWQKWGCVTPMVRTQKAILLPPGFLALRMPACPLKTCHHTVGKCSVHCPSDASRQQAASATRPGWLSLVQMTPAPSLGVFQLGPRQQEAVTSPPYCAWSEFLTHRNQEIINDYGCLRPLGFWDNWLCSNRKLKHFTSKQYR